MVESQLENEITQICAIEIMKERERESRAASSFWEQASSFQDVVVLFLSLGQRQRFEIEITRIKIIHNNYQNIIKWKNIWKNRRNEVDRIQYKKLSKIGRIYKRYMK